MEFCRFLRSVKFAVRSLGRFLGRDACLWLQRSQSVTKNCLSQVLEDSGTGSDPDITCLYKIFLERSISYEITQIRNCVKLLNLALYRSF